MIGFLIGAGAGIWALNQYQKTHPAGTTTAVGSKPVTAPMRSSQPSQQYPVQASTSPRVDNANQPWYGGALSFAATSAETYAPQLAGTAAETVSNIFGNIGAQ